MDAVKQTIADISNEGLTLETAAIVSFAASITLINTQLTHHFVPCCADAVSQFSSELAL